MDNQTSRKQNVEITKFIKQILPLSIIVYYASIKYFQYTFVHKIGQIIFNKNKLGNDRKSLKLFAHLQNQELLKDNDVENNYQRFITNSLYQQLINFNDSQNFTPVIKIFQDMENKGYTIKRQIIPPEQQDNLTKVYDDLLYRELYFSGQEINPKLFQKIFTENYTTYPYHAIDKGFRIFGKFFDILLSSPNNVLADANQQITELLKY